LASNSTAMVCAPLRTARPPETNARAPVKAGAGQAAVAVAFRRDSNAPCASNTAMSRMAGSARARSALRYCCGDSANTAPMRAKRSSVPPTAAARSVALRCAKVVAWSRAWARSSRICTRAAAAKEPQTRMMQAGTTKRMLRNMAMGRLAARTASSRLPSRFQGRAAASAMIPTCAVIRAGAIMRVGRVEGKA